MVVTTGRTAARRAPRTRAPSRGRGAVRVRGGARGSAPPPRPLSEAEVVAQLPARVPVHRSRSEDDDDRFHGDEGYIRQFFGPALHAFTVETARRLAPRFPLRCHVLWGQSWTDYILKNDTSTERRAKSVETLTLTRWNDARRRLTARVDAVRSPYGNLPAWNAVLYDDGRGRLSTGSTSDPVYVFHT